MRSRITLIVSAVIALICASILTASAHGGITGKYPAPSDLDAVDDGCDTILVEHEGSNHANFYVLKYSTNSDMSDADYQRPADQPVGDSLNDEEYVIEGLNSDDTYYIQVGVADWAGHRLSPYTAKFVERTDAVC